MNADTNPPSRLLYFLDPMCSWCWAFRPALKVVESRLPNSIKLVRVLGGLAPDTDEPMPQDLRDKLQDIWRTIQVKVPGTEFNSATGTFAHRAVRPIALVVR